MFLLLGFIVTFGYIYTALFLVYIITRLVKRREIPWILVLVNLVCLAAFFYCEYLINEYRLIFTGEYVDGRKGWGSGMANADTNLRNRLALIGLFCCIQIVFWIFFYKKVRQVRKGR